MNFDSKIQLHSGLYLRRANTGSALLCYTFNKIKQSIKLQVYIFITFTQSFEILQYKKLLLQIEAR